jgi:hypothetical protein
MMCTLEEIAGFFKCCEDTIENFCKREYEGRKFSDVYKENSSMGKISLRRAMFDKAINQKSTAMQIWLSKNQLGMSEKFAEPVNPDSNKFQLAYSLESEPFEVEGSNVIDVDTQE